MAAPINTHGSAPHIFEKFNPRRRAHLDMPNYGPGIDYTLGAERLGKVIFLRHGATIKNIKKIFAGDNKNVQLADLGMEQGMQAAELLRNIKIDRIYSSPSVRAFDTASLVQPVTGADMYIEDSLNEKRYGLLQGQSKELVKANNPTLYHSIHRLWGNPDDAFVGTPAEKVKAMARPRFRPAETLQDVITRSTPFSYGTLLSDVLSGYTDLVVSHQHWGRAWEIIVKQLQGNKLTDAEVEKIEFQNGEPNIYEFSFKNNRLDLLRKSVIGRTVE